MMKFVLLVAVCAFGLVSSETHNQRKAFSDRIIGDIEDAAGDFKEMLKHYDPNTEEGKYLISLNANALNFGIHWVVDALHYAVTAEGHSMAVQEILSQLSSITYELEQSFKNGVGAVKSQLKKTVEDIVVEAKNLRQVVRSSRNQRYGWIVVSCLDDLVTVVQEPVSRGTIHGKSKQAIKALLRNARKILTSTLSAISSTDENVLEDIVEYSTRFSSIIDETKMTLREFAFSFKPNNDAAIKEIVYQLSKIGAENDKVLYRNKNSFHKIKDQFHVTLVNLDEQVNKIVDASYSDDGNMEDVNLMYAVLPAVATYGNQLQRNFERTMDNYGNPQSNE